MKVQWKNGPRVTDNTQPFRRYDRFPVMQSTIRLPIDSFKEIGPCLRLLFP